MEAAARSMVASACFFLQNSTLGAKPTSLSAAGLSELDDNIIYLQFLQLDKARQQMGKTQASQVNFKHVTLRLGSLSVKILYL